MTKFKIVKKVGSIILAKDEVGTRQAIHVQIVKIGNGKPKISLAQEKRFWGEDDSGNPRTDTYFTSKMPLLIGENMEKINKRLPDLLKKAAKTLDDLSY